MATLLWSLIWQTFVFPHLRSRVLYAKSFVVPDADGNTRIELGLDNAGKPLLRLFGADLKTRAELGVEKNGETVLWLYDEHEGQTRPRISLGVAKDDAVGLQLFDVDGKQTVQLGVDKNNAALALGLPSNSGTVPISISALSPRSAEDPQTMAGMSIASVANASQKIEIGFNVARDSHSTERPEIYISRNGQLLWSEDPLLKQAQQ